MGKNKTVGWIESRVNSQVASLTWRKRSVKDDCVFAHCEVAEMVACN